MNPSRLTLLVVATLATGALIAGYWVDATAGGHHVPIAVFALLWLFCIVAWHGFMAVQCVVALNAHVDRRFLQTLAAIRAVDADGEDGDHARQTIDAHLAALQDIGTPTPRNGYLGLGR